ncbi:hypothetical protein NUU61_001105 [Penicillium alfredii]|uniref:Nucleolar protein Dnt1-like N-terminal domain-containing protein n=1 Tax=Penicillium alfredii TaxID=1506179 RepID=A0A9W9GAV0_9EURO|nr:uncharacterized protein NUU61_001105 [Penicillium alfredii]KAJ5115346.1 hypothetical protein NUU61_001105 [Penicillium alfredii]
MVFLRLQVKVFPREQVPSGPSFFRSILGKDNDRSRDENGRGNLVSAGGRSASFLIVLMQPEEVTLGGLAGMIQEKWKKLHPTLEPLVIKKLLDDANDTEDLDTDLTVADVFVNIGKARADGLDQRGTVCVIQKPTTESPVLRYPSVDLDWDGAAKKFEENKIKKESIASQFSPIQEEDESSRRASTAHISSDRSSPATDNAQGTPAQESPVKSRHHDTPLLSVEVQNGPIVSNERAESEELGESPSPSEHPQSRSSSTKSKSTAASNNQFSKVQTNAPPRRTVTTRRSITQMAGPASTQKRGSGSLFGTRTTPQWQRTRSAQKATETASEEEDQNESEEHAVEESGSDEHDSDIQMQAVEEEEEDDDDDDEDEYHAESESDDGSDGDIVMKENGAPRRLATPDQGPATRSRKRKQSEERSTPAKQPRLHGADPSALHFTAESPNPPKTIPPPSSPYGRRERAPSFSGPGRRSSITGRPLEPPKSGLGLGITKSPPRNKMTQDSFQATDVPLTQSSLGTPLFPSSAPTATPSTNQGLKKPKHLQSVLRTDSPANKRRSVSFADEEEPFANGPAPRSTPAGPPLSTTSRSTPPSIQGTPSGSQMVYPPGYSPETISKITQEIEQKKRQTQDIEREAQYLERKLKNRKADPKYLDIVRQMRDTCTNIAKRRKTGRVSEERHIQSLLATLSSLRNQMRVYEERRKPSASVSKSTTAKSVSKSPAVTNGDASHRTASPSSDSETSSESEPESERSESPGPPAPAPEKSSPTAKSPTPARKSLTPATKPPTPAAKSPTPVRKSPTPRRASSTAPVEKPHAPAKSSTPVHKSPIPSAKSPIFARKSPALGAKSPTPAAKSPTPTFSRRGSRSENGIGSPAAATATSPTAAKLFTKALPTIWSPPSAQPTRNPTSPKVLLETGRPRPATPPSANEPRLPPSGARVARSIPANGGSPWTTVNKSPTWSFDQSKNQRRGSIQSPTSAGPKVTEQVGCQQEKVAESVEISSSEDSEESESDSQSDEDYREPRQTPTNNFSAQRRDPPMSAPRPQPNGAPRSPALLPPFQPTPRQVPSQPALGSHTTLKGLLVKVREETARKQDPATQTAPPTSRRDVYEVPSSSEDKESSDDSSSDSDGSEPDQGDILPNGQSALLHKPYPKRV